MMEFEQAINPHNMTGHVGTNDTTFQIKLHKLGKNVMWSNVCQDDQHVIK